MTSVTDPAQPVQNDTDDQGATQDPVRGFRGGKPLKWTRQDVTFDGATEPTRCYMNGNLVVAPGSRAATWNVRHWPSGLGTRYSGKLAECKAFVAALRKAFPDLSVFDHVANKDAYDDVQIGTIRRWINAYIHAERYPEPSSPPRHRPELLPISGGSPVATEPQAPPSSGFSGETDGPRVAEAVENPAWTGPDDDENYRYQVVRTVAGRELRDGFDSRLKAVQWAKDLNDRLTPDAPPPMPEIRRAAIAAETMPDLPESVRHWTIGPLEFRLHEDDQPSGDDYRYLLEVFHRGEHVDGKLCDTIAEAYRYARGTAERMPVSFAPAPISGGAPAEAETAAPPVRDFRETKPPRWRRAEVYGRRTDPNSPRGPASRVTHQGFQSGNFAIAKVDGPDSCFYLLHYPSGWGFGIRGLLKDLKAMVAALRDELPDLSAIDRMAERQSGNLEVDQLPGDDAVLDMVCKRLRMWHNKPSLIPRPTAVAEAPALISGGAPEPPAQEGPLARFGVCDRYQDEHGAVYEVVDRTQVHVLTRYVDELSEVWPHPSIGRTHSWRPEDLDRLTRVASGLLPSRKGLPPISGGSPTPLPGFSGTATPQDAREAAQDAPGRVLEDCGGCQDVPDDAPRTAQDGQDQSDNHNPGSWPEDGEDGEGDGGADAGGGRLPLASSLGDSEGQVVENPPGGPGQTGLGDDPGRPATPWPPRGLTLAELAEMEATRFDGWRNGAGDLFARCLRALAADIRFVGAVTPREFADRADVVWDGLYAEAAS